MSIFIIKIDKKKEWKKREHTPKQIGDTRTPHEGASRR